MTKVNVGLLIAALILLVASPLSIACAKREASKAADTKPNGPAQAVTVPQPNSEKETRAGKADSDYTVEDLIENWPKDVPLMEPYKVTGYLPEYEGFRQISILLNSTMEDVYTYYADNLFNKNGWVPVQDSKSGIPDVFLSFKCRKDSRELDVMLKSEEEGKQTLVQLELTDTTVQK